MDDQVAEKRREVRARWNRSTLTFFSILVPVAIVAAGLFNFGMYEGPTNLVTVGFIIGNVVGMLALPTIIVLICHFIFRGSGKYSPIPYILAGLVFLYFAYSYYSMIRYETTGLMSP